MVTRLTQITHSLRELLSLVALTRRDQKARQAGSTRLNAINARLDFTESLIPAWTTCARREASKILNKDSDLIGPPFRDLLIAPQVSKKMYAEKARHAEIIWNSFSIFATIDGIQSALSPRPRISRAGLSRR